LIANLSEKDQRIPIVVQILDPVERERICVACNPNDAVDRTLREDPRKSGVIT